MTRFARAKGSKSSNLKAPDDSTPWEVMKEQMLQAKKETEDQKNRELAENKRIENYNNFLKERRVQKRKSTWCDFPETQHKKTNQEADDKLGKIKKSKKTVLEEGDHSERIHEVNIHDTLNNDVVNNVSKDKKKKKNKSKAGNFPIECKQNIEEVDVNKEEMQHKKEKLQSKKKMKQTTGDTTSDKKIETMNVHIEKTNMQNNKTNKQTSSNRQTDNVGTDTFLKSQSISTQKKKNKKFNDNKPTRRKEINDRSFQLIINGKEVELIRFDGFPIMKKDAERLNELKSSMIKKGIPKTEVNRTIKLERRRAEKALARLKRDVCYNCRKGGHNLSDCPELKSNIPGVQAAEGICFKCGSTEHRQFECKVQRDKEFRFANCFICKEQGHIARQCPDNPKGLYPNGGCCKLCGDVTHLRKDCPTVQQKNEGTSIKLQTLDTGSNIEDIELVSKPATDEAPKKPKKIKF